MYTTLLALPLFLERVRDHDVQTSGLVLAAMSACAALLGPLGGKLADQRGHRMPAVWGSMVLVAGTVMLVLGTGIQGLTLIFVALIAMGIGLGISGAPVQAAAIEAIPEQNAGSAAGIFSTSRYVGSVAGSSILAVMFARDVEPGRALPFALLFGGLAVAALLGVLVNSRVADPRPTAKVARREPAYQGSIGGAAVNPLREDRDR
jgi:MFS family permease